MRFVEFGGPAVHLRPEVAVHRDFTSGEGVLDVFRSPSAYENRRYGGMVNHPGERQPNHLRFHLFGHRPKEIEYLKIPLREILVRVGRHDVIA